MVEVPVEMIKALKEAATDSEGYSDFSIDPNESYKVEALDAAIDNIVNLVEKTKG